MRKSYDYQDISVELNGNTALVEIQRPPLNFFDISLINQIADAFETLDDETNCRAIVLAAQGKHFAQELISVQTNKKMQAIRPAMS